MVVQVGTHPGQWRHHLHRQRTQHRRITHTRPLEDRRGTVHAGRQHQRRRRDRQRRTLPHAVYHDCTVGRLEPIDEHGVDDAQVGTLRGHVVGRWVFDANTGARTRKITLASVAGAIQVTEDDKPLLLAAFIGSHNLDVYDARSGKHLRTVPDIGTAIFQGFFQRRDGGTGFLIESA